MEIEKDLFYRYICTYLCTCAPHSMILGASGAGIQAVLPDPITVIGAQNTYSTLNNAQNSFNNEHFEIGKFLFLFVYLYEKVTNAQYPIPRIWHIKFDLQRRQ